MTTTYSTPLCSLNCTATTDYVYFYATASGFQDSPFTLVDNRGKYQCVAPCWVFSGTLTLDSGNITLINNRSAGHLFLPEKLRRDRRPSLQPRYCGPGLHFNGRSHRVLGKRAVSAIPPISPLTTRWRTGGSIRPTLTYTGNRSSVRSSLY